MISSAFLSASCVILVAAPGTNNFKSAEEVTQLTPSERPSPDSVLSFEAAYSNTDDASAEVDDHEVNWMRFWQEVRNERLAVWGVRMAELSERFEVLPETIEKAELRASVIALKAMFTVFDPLETTSTRFQNNYTRTESAVAALE